MSASHMYDLPALLGSRELADHVLWSQMHSRDQYISVCETGVLYGLLQILISFRKLQGMMDALRAKQRFWYLRAISACMTLLFGLLIVLNPNMTFMSIWVFTGITLLVEGVFDCVLLTLQLKKAHTGGNA